jgi:hypothetical protein
MITLNILNKQLKTKKMKQLIFAAATVLSIALLAFNKNDNKELTALDKIEIMETSARLDNSLDKEDLKGFVGVFTAKGVLEVGGNKSTGPAEIEQAFHYMLNNFARGRRHIVTNEIITGNQTEAKMESYLNVVNREDFGRRGSAIQHDVFVKENGQWKIAHRTIEIDPSFFKGQK